MELSSYFGEYGGFYVPESLVLPLTQLKDFFNKLAIDNNFKEEFHDLLKNYAGRPTPLTEVHSFNHTRLFLKREDLLHTGAHKINNALGQCLLAKKNG